MGKLLEFQVIAGQPIRIDVIKDGKSYEIRMGVAVIAVEDGEMIAEDGMPKFNVQANLALDVREKK